MGAILNNLCDLHFYINKYKSFHYLITQNSFCIKFYNCDNVFMIISFKNNNLLLKKNLFMFSTRFPSLVQHFIIFCTKKFILISLNNE